MNTYIVHVQQRNTPDTESVYTVKSQEPIDVVVRAAAYAELKKMPRISVEGLEFKIATTITNNYAVCIICRRYDIVIWAVPSHRATDAPQKIDDLHIEMAHKLFKPDCIINDRKSVNMIFSILENGFDNTPEINI